MERKQTSSVAICTALGMALLIGMSTTYAVAYFALGVRQDTEMTPGLARHYPHRWQMQIFRPAKAIESAVTGQTVLVFWSYSDKTGLHYEYH